MPTRALAGEATGRAGPCKVTEGSVQRAPRSGSSLLCLAIFNIFEKGASHCYFAVRPKHSVAGPHSRRKKKESREGEGETEADGSGHARK